MKTGWRNLRLYRCLRERCGYEMTANRNPQKCPECNKEQRFRPVEVMVNGVRVTKWEQYEGIAAVEPASRRWLRCRSCGTVHEVFGRLKRCQKCGHEKFEVAKNSDIYKAKSEAYHKALGRPVRGETDVAQHNSQNPKALAHSRLRAKPAPGRKVMPKAVIT
jgi:predicted Zn-ribbon and HTH transcriptional regulator